MKNCLEIYVHHIVNIQRKTFEKDLSEFFMPFIKKTIQLPQQNIYFQINIGGFHLLRFELFNSLSTKDYFLYKNAYITDFCLSKKDQIFFNIGSRSISSKNPFIEFLQEISTEESDILNNISSYIKSLREEYPTKSITYMIFPLVEDGMLLDRLFAFK
jgi:hypothetical protein